MNTELGKCNRVSSNNQSLLYKLNNEVTSDESLLFTKYGYNNQVVCYMLFNEKISDNENNNERYCICSEDKGVNNNVVLFSYF